MHEFADWSVGLGRWKGVPVRIHLLFVLFAVLLLVLASAGSPLEIASDSALAIGLLLMAVAVHEMAHVAVAKRLEGEIDEVVIGPFGGLARPRVPDLPQVHLLVALAGPLVNLFCAALLGAVLFAYQRQPVWELLHPFAPSRLIEGSALEVCMKLGFWINWLLALVNFLPVFPFDGAIIYRAALRYNLGARTAGVYVARGGYACALALLVLAWWQGMAESASPLPVWLALVLAAVFVAFSAHRDGRRIFRARGRDRLGDPSNETMEDEMIEFEQLPAAEEDEGLTGDEFSAARSWCPDNEDDLEEEKLDDVLARLHHSGLEALSVEDRQLLERASRRYRNRLRKRSIEDA